MLLTVAVICYVASRICELIFCAIFCVKLRFKFLANSSVYLPFAIGDFPLFLETLLRKLCLIVEVVRSFTQGTRTSREAETGLGSSE